MSKPTLKLNGTDYTQYVQEITPTLNDLDADGSGRNILDGTMYRSLIATKLTLTVTLMPEVSETAMAALINELKSGSNYVSVTWKNAGASETLSMYNSTFNMGKQIYKKSEGITYYAGASFEVIER